MDPLIGGALISGAGQLLGGLFGNKSNKKTASMQAAMQREFAQNGIRWKVADAKAAGVHPLYALGAQTASYSPVAIQDAVGPAIGSASQDLGRAFAAQETNDERALKALQMEHLRAQTQTEYAQASLYSSQAAKTAQERLQSAPLPHDLSMLFSGGSLTGPSTGRSGTTDKSGRHVVTPAEVISHRPGQPGLTAGPNQPAMTEYTLPGGLPLTGMHQISEAMGETPLMLWPEVIRTSAKAAKMDTGDYLFQLLTGKSPSKGSISGALKNYYQAAMLKERARKQRVWAKMYK